MKTIRWFRIDGMTTPSSECTVRAALHALPGVERAEVSFADGLAVVLAPLTTSDERILAAMATVGCGGRRIGDGM